MNIHQQAVQGARFFDLDTRHGSGGRLFLVHNTAYGDELTMVNQVMSLDAHGPLPLRCRTDVIVVVTKPAINPPLHHFGRT